MVFLSSHLITFNYSEDSMNITGKNSETGEEFSIESEKVDSDFINSMSIFEMADDAVKRLIDNLDVSADAKKLLYKFSQITIKAGEMIVKIGRKIIDFVCKIYKEFPSATFGIIFGAIVGLLVSTIPILGAVLGAFFTPIAMIFGLLSGLKEDIKDKNLVRKIAEANKQFAPLGA